MKPPLTETENESETAEGVATNADESVETPAARARRAVCAACRRPRSVCTCRFLRPTPTRTRLLFLQHAREARMPIGTARLAHLGLPSSALHAGISFEDHAEVRAWLAAARQPYLLFPGPSARDLYTFAPHELSDLVIVDGTWWQAQKLLRLNPMLAALPRVAFTPREPSRYRIRKQPEAFCVSTIEAVAEVLGVLEPESGPYDALLAPFFAMVEGQLRFARDVKSERHAHAKRARALVRKPGFPARVRETWERLVCVQGEANAWPARAEAGKNEERPRAEIVHWVAARPSDGSRFEAIVAPTGAIAPNIPQHIGLPPEALRAGVARAAWMDGWRAFLRPGDVLVHWGSFHRNLAEEEGLAPGDGAWDLRFELSRWQKRRVGLLEEGLALLQGAAPGQGPAGPREGEPRALERLEGLLAIVRAAHESET